MVKALATMLRIDLELQDRERNTCAAYPSKIIFTRSHANGLSPLVAIRKSTHT